ncbi:MAG TPA: hypothetical protein DCY88_21895 [Cyanobacteria bacterium UBA11372]|nr:hypothetical protein [Cyanobacteria bacterium UBA11372]
MRFIKLAKIKLDCYSIQGNVQSSKTIRLGKPKLFGGLQKQNLTDGRGEIDKFAERLSNLIKGDDKKW